MKTNKLPLKFYVLMAINFVFLWYAFGWANSVWDNYVVPSFTIEHRMKYEELRRMGSIEWLKRSAKETFGIGD